MPDSLQWNSLFAIFNAQGDVDGREMPAGGLYSWDTRLLRVLHVALRDHDLEPISKRAEPGRLAYALRDHADPGLVLQKDVVVGGGSLQVHWRLENRSDAPLVDELWIELEADFQDIFEVQGGLEPLPRRISFEAQGSEANGPLLFRYEGQDGLRREVAVEVHGLDARQLEAQGGEGEPLHVRLRSPVRLVPAQVREGRLKIRASTRPAADREGPPVLRLLTGERPPRRLAWRLPALQDSKLARLIRQARLDLESLMFHFDRGFVPAAGLPWFGAIFGRDSLITAWEVLPVLPELARGVLAVLGEFQAEGDDPERDAQPGKIPHEIRLGERSLLGDLPFAPYYGSVDATPLFVMLLGEYLKVTKDWAFLAQMAGKLRSALDWILQGLRTGQGFLYYRRQTARGLENQGWKDSEEAVCFCDGQDVHGRAIALVEVQGYAYAALRTGAALLEQLGEREEAARLRAEAEGLKRRFNREFWLEREGYFALALAEGLGPVDAITSNPGHGLLTGIIEEGYIPEVVQRLLSPELFSGFGIRTMATTCAAYDPLSYHKGSVWPHDNALILLGLLHLGFVREARRVAQGLLEAACHFEGRLPELFGGFSREEALEPVPYPGACVPQAWATGTVFVLLRALHPLRQDQEREAA